LAAVGTRTVVLVEGLSDKLALEALARRRGRDLDAESVEIVSMGGSKNIATYLERFALEGVRLAGLCDAGEVRDFARGLERAGLGSDLTRADMERRGFFVCVADLEDELIRALGADAVVRVIDHLREAGQWQTFQKQPQWRGRAPEEQLRRFFGTHSGRKAAAAPLLIDALELDRVPEPLDRLLSYV
jgi:hypothetical protein